MRWLGLLPLVLAVPLAAQTARETPRPAPPEAGETVALLDASPVGADLPNFGKAHDWLFRGAQPSEAGFKLLDERGIRTIINLRKDPRQAEKEGALVRRFGMRYVHLPMAELKAPKDEDVERFLRMATDYRFYPIFVHCRRGADRTGAVMAAYRIEADVWGLRRTLKEMLKFKALSPAHIKYVLDFYRHKNPTASGGTAPRPPMLGRAGAVPPFRTALAAPAR